MQISHSLDDNDNLALSLAPIGAMKNKTLTVLLPVTNCQRGKLDRCMITIFQLINDSKQSTKLTNEIRTFSNKMMRKSIRCLARHPSSTLKNLEMAVLILELEFMTACLGMPSTLECI